MSCFAGLFERRWEGTFTLERWMSNLWAEATGEEHFSYRATEDDGGLTSPVLATIVA